MLELPGADGLQIASISRATKLVKLVVLTCKIVQRGDAARHLARLTICQLTVVLLYPNGQ